jgi:hypothetical protein
MSSVPIFAPDGSYGEVPYEQFKAAVAAGAKPAVRVQAPDGSFGHVPADRFPDAVKAGAKPAPLEDQPKGVPDYYGFTPKNMASNALEGAKGVVKGAYELGKDLLSNPNWITGPNSTYEKFIGAPAEGEARKASAAFGQGHYVEAAGHELAGALPLVGPAAAQIGEQAGSGDVGGAAAKGAAQVATPILAGKAAGAVARVAAPAAKAFAERSYQSALKPPPGSYSTAEVAGMVKTGLENQIPVSAEGMTKLDGLVKDLNDKVKAQIQSGAQQGATVDAAKIAQRADQVRARFTNQVNPNADMQAIDASKQEFLANNPARIPVDQAQLMKQGTYQQLKGRSFGELKSATIESQKALARGIKEELQSQFPDIKNLNAREGQLIGLDEALERAVRRIDNHQLIGLGTPMAVAAGGVLTGTAGGAGALGALKLVLDNPVVKSKLAIALNHASKGRIALPEAFTTIQNYSGALANAQPSDNQGQ